MKSIRMITVAAVLALTGPAATLVPGTALASASQAPGLDTGPGAATVAASCQRSLHFYPTVRPGDHSAAVRTLQCFVNDAGGEVVVDGQYGPQTRRAVVALIQRWHPAYSSGVVGPSRWVTVISATLPGRVLSQGDRGPGVHTLQRALKAGRLGADVTLVMDGVFGPRTKGFLQEWQRQNGLRQTGATNLPTRRRLHAGGTVVFEG
jgi:peptidoglycan hydrolase-like protein with peptidoglycan-binding domain